MENVNQQKTVLVIGASRGIGAATASRFLAEGYLVAGTHRGSGVPEGVIGLKVDIRNADAIQDAVKTATKELSRLDTLIVTAGITRDSLLMRMSADDLREVMETNAIGPMLACKAALRPMLKQRSGSIVLVSSMSVKYGVPGQTNYTASKGAIEAFARSLAREHGKQGLRVNVVAPGATDTDMMSAMPDEERAHMLEGIPMGRLGTVTEVAEAILHTSESTYMSAAVVSVGGGL